jgi:hypothetical protein
MIASRREWVVDWGELVGELSGLTADEIRRAVESTPVIAEIVGTAWEMAARSADEEKRRLLAKVASAALRGDDDVALDELQFFVRTARRRTSACATLGDHRSARRERRKDSKTGPGESLAGLDRVPYPHVAAAGT